MDFDLTIVFQLVIFLGLMGLLHAVFLKPAFAVIQRRETATDGALAEAAEMNAAGDLARADYQVKIRAAARDAQDTRQALVQAGRVTERERLAAARSEVATRLGEERAGLGTQQEGAREALDGAVPDLSTQLASKVLGRGV